MSDSYILEIKNKRKDFINSFEKNIENIDNELIRACLLYTSPSPRDY